MTPAIVALSSILLLVITLFVALMIDYKKLIKENNLLKDDHKQLQSHIREPEKLDKELVLRRVLEDFAENEYGYAKFALRLVYGRK